MDSVESVDKMLVCRGCGLMTGRYVHPENPVCPECFNRINWSKGQGPMKFIAKDGDCRHETALCPALQNATTWYMTRDEHVYLDYRHCRRCRSHRTFGFDHHRGDETAPI